ncbi:MAG: hypothetical protein ACI9BD_001256, partial [Candidatus Marinamargulisbacteria bacterium]
MGTFFWRILRKKVALTFSKIQMTPARSSRLSISTNPLDL